MARLAQQTRSTSSSIWVRWAAAAIATLALVGVFVVPWFVHVPILPISSDSQALGFSNRTAEIILVLSSLALAALALLSARDSRGSSRTPVVLLAPCERRDRVSRGLFIALSVAVVAMVAIMATIYRIRLFGDSGYFLDRLMYVMNGRHVYSEFEFAYGPLLLFPTYGVFRLLRGVGVGLYAAYYITTAGMHVLGLSMTAYALNRLRMPKASRNVVLAVVAGFSLCFIGLGQNYTAVRFLTPFVLMLWALRQSEKHGLVAVLLAPLVAVGVSFAVSPEMGLVATAGLGTAYVVGAISGRRTWWLGAITTATAAAAGAVLYSLGGASMFGAFSAGAVYFPILLSQGAVVYVVAVLIAGWGVGATTTLSNLKSAAPQLGWLASSYVLVAAAFGRADFVHLFWNGLGLFLLVTACLWSVARRFAAAFPVVVGAVFIVAGITYAWVGLGYGVVACASRSGALTKSRSAAISTFFGRPPSWGIDTWKASQRRDPLPADLRHVIRSHSVIPLFALDGQLGMTLAKSKGMARSYSPPWSLYSRAQVDRELADIRSAQYLLLPTSDYQEYLRRYEAARAEIRDGMWVGPLERGAGGYAGFTGFPLAARPAHPTLDTWAVFGQTFRQDWAVLKTSGDYTILVPKGR